MCDGNLAMQNSQQYNSEEEFNQAYNSFCYQPLFNLMHEEFGIIVLESDMDEIIRASNKVIENFNKK